MTTVVAERTLEFFGDEGVGAGLVRIEAPEMDVRLDLSWIGRCEVSWPGYNERRAVFAVDSWGAVLSAYVAAISLVAEAADFRGGRIGLHGKRLTSKKELSEAFGLSRVGD